MNQKLFDIIQTIFYEKLESKTGWGKNEIKHLYAQSVAEAALQMIDQA